MYLTPFAAVFREQGQKKCRVISTRGYPGLPDDEYALSEAYCSDPKCDCRRVMLNVTGRHRGGRYLASISFGFDRDAEMADPFLDPLNRQSQYADALFRLVAQVLADPAYTERLESHYRQFKHATADPQDPAYETIRRIWLDEKRWDGPPARAVADAKKTVTTARKKRRKK